MEREDWFSEELNKKLRARADEALFGSMGMTVPVFTEAPPLTVETIREAARKVMAFDPGPGLRIWDTPMVMPLEPERSIKILSSAMLGLGATATSAIMPVSNLAKDFDEIVISARQIEIKKELEFLKLQGTKLWTRAGYRKAYRAALAARRRSDAQLFGEVS